MLRKLTLESLAHVDEGRLKKALELHLAKLTDDCTDRPGVDTARSLTLKIDMIPLSDTESGQCDDVNIEFTIGSTLPKTRSKMLNCKVRKSAEGAQLVFNDMSEGDADQRTLDQAAPSFVPNQGQQPAA